MKPPCLLQQGNHRHVSAAHQKEQLFMRNASNTFPCTTLFAGFCSLALLCLPATAHEPGPHVHGAAELQVVIDGPVLEISLETPLDNVLGFEHVPKTDKQRAAVRSMAARLRQAQTLFVPQAEAQCSLSSVQLESTVLSADLLGETQAMAAKAQTEKGGHGDLDGTFTFVCGASEQLVGMEVNLMKAFPGFRKINVSVVGPKGQSATLLTPKQRSIRW
jgi:hypothetical protein